MFVGECCAGMLVQACANVLSFVRACCVQVLVRLYFFSSRSVARWPHEAPLKLVHNVMNVLLEPLLLLVVERRPV